MHHAPISSHPPTMFNNPRCQPPCSHLFSSLLQKHAKPATSLKPHVPRKLHLHFPFIAISQPAPPLHSLHPTNQPPLCSHNTRQLHLHLQTHLHYTLKLCTPQPARGSNGKINPSIPPSHRGSHFPTTLNVDVNVNNRHKSRHIMLIAAMILDLQP